MQYTLFTEDGIIDYLRTLLKQRRTPLQLKEYLSILLQHLLLFASSPAYLVIIVWNLELTLIQLVMYGKLQFGIQYPSASVYSASLALAMFWSIGYFFLLYHQIPDQA